MLNDDSMAEAIKKSTESSAEVTQMSADTKQPLTVNAVVRDEGGINSREKDIRHKTMKRQSSLPGGAVSNEDDRQADGVRRR
jgi:hypothetical protein